MEDLCTELESGASALLLPEESLVNRQADLLHEWLDHQPPWSDLPILVMSRPGADSSSVTLAMNLFHNVTVLERPMRVSALVSAVKSALRARQRQYQIRDHLAALEKAERELRLADQRKDEFLAVLAHELRNPLAPIRSALEILHMKSGLGPDVESLRSLIERQVGHMVRLVDDLLEISRITTGKIELRMVTTDLNAVIKSAIETSQPLIQAKDHRLVVDFPAKNVCVEADPIRLAQVFSNLLNNATKYTDPGGEIGLTVSEHDSVIEVVIRDNGMGINPESLPRVFEMFAQIDSTSDRSQGGLGIGLTLVKSLVQMHGGEVMAHSSGLGRGSVFTVRLPMSSAGRVEEIAETTPKAGAFSHRFLVVDDNEDAANTLSMLLKIRGAEVKTVYSGEDALTTLESYSPRVVLLDIGMPGMNGLEVAKAIRSQPRLSSAVLIALTGWGQDEDRRLSQEAGFDQHLVKPIEPNKLETLLSAMAGESNTPTPNIKSSPVL